MSDYDDGSEQSSRAGNAAKGAAKTGAKKAGKSLGRKLILIPLVIGLCLLVIAAAAAAITGQQAAAQRPGISCGVAVPAGQVSGTAAGFTAEQNANAKGIISVALGLGLGYQRALIGVLTADVESDCSGLSAYVVVQGGFACPGGNSSAQAQSTHAVARDQGVPGVSSRSS